MDNTTINNLKAWFLDCKRDFPWRENLSPYSVWVSEVMLQQTQASVVIPYFLRWMQLFPTIQDLAEAPLEIVLKAWEGLGYYSRARNLHQGARYVLDNYNGQFPDSIDALNNIKGLGPYTIGAILSLAFHQRIEAVDGNVIRVLARFYGISDDIAKGSTLKYIRSLALALLPEDEPWVVNEALIELGATTCARKSKCMECPLNTSCKAFALGLSDTLPIKSAKTAITPLYRSVAVLCHNNSLLIRHVPKGQIMSDLCEFPYFEIDSPNSCPKHLEQIMLDLWNIEMSWLQALPEVRQSFTRYRARLYPHLFSVKHLHQIPECNWISVEELNNLAFSSGHRRIFEFFSTNYKN